MEIRSPEARRSRWASPLVLGVSLCLAALSLRPQLVGVGPLIPFVQSDLGMSHAVAALLGTIPVLCMGLFGFAAPILAARFGTARTMAVSLALIGILGLARAWAADSAQLLLSTFGVGVGISIGGTLMPTFVKQHLGTRPLAGTVAYSAGIQLGSALAGFVAVPLALALGSWRGSLQAISLGTLALLLPLLLLLRADRGSYQPSFSLAWHDFRDTRGWVLALVFGLFGTVYYGLVSWLADTYVDSGWTNTAAGNLVAVLNAGALLGAVTIGLLVGRLLPYRVAVAVLGAAFAVGVAGFVIAPAAGFLWSFVAGYANGALYPLVLALPLRLVPSAARVAALSSMMLGAGYALAALGPLAIGLARDASGSFRAGLVMLAVVAAAFAVGAALIARWPVHAEA